MAWGGDGIVIENAGTASYVTLSVGEVTGAMNGIDIYNAGTGTLDVLASGPVTGLGGDGIEIVQSTLASDLFIDAGVVTGSESGISVTSNGTGAVTISGIGDVTGKGDNGIEVINGLGSGNLSTSYTNVVGYDDGIEAKNYGIGEMRIVLRGTVTGETGDGIEAFNSGGATDLILSADGIIGGQYGVLAENNGSGQLLVSVDGDISGQAVNGVKALNFGTDLTVKASIVTGDVDGIDARNEGSGALSVAVGDSVTAQGGVGVRVVNFGTDMNLELGDVSASGTAINGYKKGSGTFEIAASGLIASDTGSGIAAINNGTDMIVAVSDIDAQVFGMYVLNDGSGVLSITSDGTIASNETMGIFASNDGTDLAIDVADVFAGGTAIQGINYGTGDLTIRSTGSLVGAQQELGGHGVATLTGLDSQSMLIDVVDVDGQSGHGIFAQHQGNGAFRIDGKGAMVGAQNGVYARIYGPGQSMVIDVKDVFGLEGAIDAKAYDLPLAAPSNATIAIRTSGTIAAASGAEAVVRAETGATGAIVIENAGMIEVPGEDTFAIATYGASTSVINLADGLIDGALSFSAYDDEVLNAGTMIMKQMSQLGDGDDAFDNAGVLILAADFDFGAGEDSFVNGGTIDVAGEVRLFGLESLTNVGTVDMAGGATGDMLTFAGNYAGVGGALALDVDFATGLADMLALGGAATGSTTIELNPLNGGLSGFGNTILLVDTGEGSEAGAFSIGPDSEQIGFISYDVVFDAGDNDYLLASAPSTGHFALRGSRLVQASCGTVRPMLGLPRWPQLEAAQIAGSGSTVTASPAACRRMSRFQVVPIRPTG